MDAIAAIKLWLENPTSYDKGLELLKLFNPGDFIISILSTGPDHYNTPKLYNELEKIFQTHCNIIQTRELAKPKELREKEETADHLMDRRGELKAQLRFLKDDPTAAKKREVIAFEILDITRQLNDFFDTKEFYQDHGYLPSGDLDVDDDPISLKKRQLTLRTYVTKYQKAGNIEKLKTYTEELAIIDKKLERHAL